MKAHGASDADMVSWSCLISAGEYSFWSWRYCIEFEQYKFALYLNVRDYTSWRSATDPLHKALVNTKIAKHYV